MKADGLENVHTERVMVPRWVRGAESAEIVDPPRHPIAMLGLGGTVATPPGGIESEVVVVSNFEDLRAKRAQVPGRIVLFDVAYTTYAETMSYRTGGARLAAEYGAAAVLVRSVGPIGLRTPHTGSVNYMPGQPQIPAAAVAAEDANRIVRLTNAGRHVRVRLVTSGGWKGRRRRRTSSARSSAASAPTKWCSSAATSTRGTWGRAPRTTAPAASSRGRRCG
jgi:carboxypeptidase Q